MPVIRWRWVVAAGTLLAANAAPASEPETLPPPRVLGTPAPALVPVSPYAAAPPPVVVAEGVPVTSAFPAAPNPGNGGRLRVKHGQGLQSCLIGYPNEFVAPPLGATIARHFQTQVANGEAARMVLYDCDFLPDGAGLNCRGLDRLAQIRGLLPRTAFPVVVERTPGCPGLAEARRLAVLYQLNAGPFPVPVERVVIGPSPATGLSGVEAEIIYNNLLNQTQRQGARGVGGGTGASAAPAVPTTPNLPVPTQR